MTLPRYPAYKDSGVEWLGELPNHWGVGPLKRMVSIQNGADHKSIEVDIGYPVIGSGGAFAYASDYLYEGESVLFGRKGTIDKPLHVKGRFWTVDTMYWSRILPAAHGRFCYYVALTIPYGYYSTSTALPSMTKGDLNSHLVPFPPVGEQTDIASFLDHETSRIDALIAEQQNLIALLKEKRQAVISHAVTKGLNPDVPMKDLGVEWLGEVPEHWTIGPVKRFFCFHNYKRIPLSAEERSRKQGEYPYYGASGIIDYVDEFIFDEPLVLVSEDGANLFNGSTPIAFVARGRYWVNNHAHILKPIDDCVEFWASRLEQLSLDPFITGSAQPKLTADALGNIIIAAPPSDAERRHIQRSIGHFDEQYLPLIGEANNAIRLLQERRSALISAAVTGKIDVRGRVAEEAA